MSFPSLSRATTTGKRVEKDEEKKVRRNNLDAQLSSSDTF